jgi:hypothetical protein
VKQKGVPNQKSEPIVLKPFTRSNARQPKGKKTARMGADSDYTFFQLVGVHIRTYKNEPRSQTGSR